MQKSNTIDWFHVIIMEGDVKLMLTTLILLIPISLQTDGIKPFLFWTPTVWSNTIHSLKYQMSTKWGCIDIGFRKFEDYMIFLLLLN